MKGHLKPKENRNNHSFADVCCSVNKISYEPGLRASPRVCRGRIPYSHFPHTLGERSYDGCSLPQQRFQILPRVTRLYLRNLFRGAGGDDFSSGGGGVALAERCTTVCATGILPVPGLTFVNKCRPDLALPT